MVSKARKAAAQASSNITGRKNLLFNGNMAVWQRGTSHSAGASAGYTADRWRNSLANNEARFTQSRDTEAPAGFDYSMKLDCTTAEDGPAANESVLLQQRIEGRDLQQLKKGTSSAEPLTLSFWVRSPKTGIHSVGIFEATNSRFIGSTYTVASADTWEFHSCTFAGDTSGAIDNDNTEGLSIWWWFVAGSDYTGGTFATSWESYTEANLVHANQVNVFDSTSNNFYLTGCQLEVGNSPTPFEAISQQDNLFRCQRYYYVITAMTAYLYSLIDSSGGSVYNRITFTHPPMRSNAPTGSISNTISSAASQGFQYAQEKTSTVYGNPSSGGTLTLLSSATITLTDEL